MSSGAASPKETPSSPNTAAAAAKAKAKGTSTSSRLSEEDSTLSKQFIAFLDRLQFDKTLRCFADELKESLDNSSTTAPGAEDSSNNTTTATDPAGKTAGSPKKGSSNGPTTTASSPAATGDKKKSFASPSSLKASDNFSPKNADKPKQETVPSAPPTAPPAAVAGKVEFKPLVSTQRGPIEEWPLSDSGIVTLPGDPLELWEVEDFNNNQSPIYTDGAGLTQEEHEQARKTEPPMVTSDPYQKQLPQGGSLESFDLRVIYESAKTGFETAKEYPIVIGDVIAGRYQVTEYVGSAAFSRAVQCVDLKYGHEVCIKIIRNGKDFFDQALDEVKLLQYINMGKDPDEVHVLQLYDYFYFKEHVFLVCELLRDNLYEFAKYNREEEEEFYFTLSRIRKIAKQVLEALAYIHSLGLLHCDLKPENVLIKSYSRCEVKVIDFGSSCFTSDSLSSYIQSRCYRAPEVVLGCKYDGKIDVWSLGAILPELITGHVIFQADSVPAMLARMAAVIGPFPAPMLYNGRHCCRFVTKHGVFYEYQNETNNLLYHFPRRTSLRRFLGSDDEHYVDFITRCLTLDPRERPSAAELLQHPFITAGEQ